MPNFIITGGHPLFGSVRVGGAKNASYKLMIAALLAHSESRILNFSHISDVQLVAKIIRSLGGRAEEVGERAYMIDGSSLKSSEIDPSFGEVSRASTLFIPALLVRFGKAVVPNPGGDKIGARPLDRHFEGLQALGAKVETANGLITVTAEKLQGTTYRFAKNTHTGTETLLMAAVLAEGTTLLENAAEEVEVDDLIAFLNEMGAKITRKPGRVIEIQGVKELKGAIHKIMPDRNEIVSYACAAIATKGDIVVENAKQEHLTAFLQKLEEAGGGYEVGSYGIRFFYKGELKGVAVETAIHPGFMTDWQPLWVTMMTQARGESIVHETVSESRFQYVDSLNEMGAQISLFQPEVADPNEVYNFNLDGEKTDAMHAVKIQGPTSLKAGEFEVKDLRHGATLIVAGMLADGKTVLRDPHFHIARGYESLDARLRAMGAHIESIE